MGVGWLSRVSQGWDLPWQSLEPLPGCSSWQVAWDGLPVGGRTSPTGLAPPLAGCILCTSSSAAREAWRAPVGSWARAWVDPASARPSAGQTSWAGPASSRHLSLGTGPVQATDPLYRCIAHMSSVPWWRKRTMMPDSCEASSFSPHAHAGSARRSGRTHLCRRWPAAAERWRVDRKLRDGPVMAVQADRPWGVEAVVGGARPRSPSRLKARERRSAIRVRSQTAGVPGPRRPLPARFGGRWRRLRSTGSLKTTWVLVAGAAGGADGTRSPARCNSDGTRARAEPPHRPSGDGQVPLPARKRRTSSARERTRSLLKTLRRGWSTVRGLMNS
jgi:hypothetical protein